MPKRSEMWEPVAVCSFRIPNCAGLQSNEQANPLMISEFVSPTFLPGSLRIVFDWITSFWSLHRNRAFRSIQLRGTKLLSEIRGKTGSHDTTCTYFRTTKKFLQAFSKRRILCRNIRKQFLEISN
jgi:hypothetical protein